MRSHLLLFGIDGRHALTVAETLNKSVMAANIWPLSVSGLQLELQGATVYSGGFGSIESHRTGSVRRRQCAPCAYIGHCFSSMHTVKELFLYCKLVEGPSDGVAAIRRCGHDELGAYKRARVR